MLAIFNYDEILQGMDGWVEGWIDELMDGWMEGLMKDERWMD
jgi:hypothetical protein